ncbi:MAG: YitT family protein [Oscillospiraceae bacterium]|nr:YitT family protein [Oscillospiraceae bacterium]
MVKRCLVTLLGSCILAFGLCHIHALSGVTEGGQLGLTLLLHHWLHITPAISALVINIICYAAGWKALGKSFLFYSLIAAVGFSGFYRIFEQFPPVFPELAQYPLAAALLGAVFVGIGCGLCVRIGGAPCGDDALAIILSHIFKTKIEYFYMISDITVLLLSLSYIPVQRIGFSLLTVLLSSKLVGIVQRFNFPTEAKHEP